MTFLRTVVKVGKFVQTVCKFTHTQSFSLGSNLKIHINYPFQLVSGLYWNIQ